MAENAKWYVVHTYSGYENAVAAAILKAAENRKMTDLIHEVNIPMETVTEHTDAGEKTYERKVFPGYVLVKMIITSESWYVVRNTRGVTGFVGPESKPVPLSDEEVERMLTSRSREARFNIAVGEDVRILSGPLENFTGTVEEIDMDRAKIRVKVKMFLGREMQVEVDLDQVQKME